MLFLIGKKKGRKRSLHADKDKELKVIEPFWFGCLQNQETSAKQNKLYLKNLVNELPKWNIQCTINNLYL